ncbi:MAG TPA: type II toxin-antitoxin system Phd/YefM family antitoxin [Chloroflexota bacterium]|jgi:antitoxin (DNA-binding transcriptional repressor) of toxin-antitoxin stability system
MAKRVRAAQAKAQLSALVAQLASGGEHVIIERRGKPLAALVRSEASGLPPWIGAWGDVLSDEEIDQFIADVYAARERDLARITDPPR